MLDRELYVRQKYKFVRETREKGRHAGLEFECPVCKKEYHASIRLATGMWICFHCGASGNFPKLVALTEGSSVKQAIRRISAGELSAGTQGQIERIEGFWDEQEESEESTEMVIAPLPDEFIPITFHPYLYGRGVSEEEAAYHHLGLCEQGIYAGRIVIPIMEYAEVVGFVARDYTGKADRKEIDPYTKKPYKKILNPPISISNMVWNLDSCFDYNRIVLCEGVFSAFRVGYDAVATFGKTISSEQARKIRQAGVREVVLMWDSDVRLSERWINVKRKNGKMQVIENPAYRRMRMLADQFVLRVVTLKTGDPGDYPRDQLRDLIEHAPLFSHDISTI